MFLKTKPNLGLRITAVIVAVVIFAPLFLYLGFRLAYADRIFPNTSLGSLEVGGLSREVAQSVLRTRLAALEQSGLVVRAGNQETQLPIDEGSLGLNAEQAVARAWSRGRTVSLGEFFDGISAPWRQRQYDLGMSIDEADVKASINDFADLVDDSAKDVRLNIRGASVSALYDTQVGYVLNRGQLIADTLSHIRALNSLPVQGQMVNQSPIIDPATAPAAIIKAQHMIAQPLLFTDSGQRFEATPTTIGTWITSTADGRTLTPTPDRQAISEYVATIASQINQPAQNLGIRVTDGKVVDFVAPRSGRVVKEDDVIQSIIDELQRRSEGTISTTAIVLPIVIQEADTAGDAASLGIKELIGQATTPFSGSPPNRISNIKNGTRFLTGQIVQPGEEFSTLKALGTIDNTTGYLPELVIKGNRTTPEFGGGLCQVSTTLFRAVLNAGLPVTARQNHSYRVSYYEKDGDGKTIGPGLDATIYQPAPDFRFLNDTGNSIFISGYVVGDRLTFELYGTKDGRAAVVDGPHLLTSTPPGDPIYAPTDTLKPGEQKQIEHPHPGGSAIATYHVTYADGTVKEQVFKSFYRPWPAQYLVGVDPATLPPATTPGTTTNTTPATPPTVSPTPD